MAYHSQIVGNKSYKNFESSQGKMTHYTQGNQKSNTTHFSLRNYVNQKTVEYIKSGQHLKNNIHTNCEPRNVHLAKMSLENKTKKEEFLDKGKLK